MAFPSTFKNMQDEVIAMLRLEDTLDRSAVKDWINQAYYEAIVACEFYESSSAASALAANATSCAVPTALVGIDYVIPTGSDGTIYGPMEEIGLDELLRNRSFMGGTITQGAPSRYAWRSASAPSIEIWPQAVGGEILTFYGFCLPTALSADADLPIIPEPFASRILTSGAEATAAQFKQNVVMLPQYEAENKEWLVKLRSFVNNRGGNIVQQFKVYNYRPVVPPTNSVDVRNW